MKREEEHHIRDLRFSRWVRDLWPDSRAGFVAMDVDYILYNYKTRRFALIEVKCRKAECTFAQRQLLQFLHGIATAGVKSQPGWTYEGVWVVQFEREVPGDGGRIWVDGIEVNEEHLRFAFRHIIHPGSGVARSENATGKEYHPSVKPFHSAEAKK